MELNEENRIRLSMWRSRDVQVAEGSESIRPDVRCALMPKRIQIVFAFRV